ncbi:Ig-like domain-containing protein [Thalassospira sp. MA62]|nr:Ig-like domain-containing protein [Thalassospira sp. MA62]
MTSYLKRWFVILAGFFLCMALGSAVVTAEENTLPLNGTVNGERLSGQGELVYKLVVPEAGNVTIDFTSMVDDRIYIVLKDNMNEDIFHTEIRGSSSSPGREFNSMDLEAGEYRFIVYDASYHQTNHGKFVVKTSFTPVKTNDIEPNNGTAEAQPLKFGQTTKGFLSIQDEVDVYEVKLTKAGRLQLDLSTYVDDQLLLFVIDDMNQQVYYEDISGSKKNPGKLVHGVDLEPGTYYISIQDSGIYSTDTGMYQLKSTFIPALNQEAEPNNGSAEAKPFPFYQTRTGFLSWNDSIDVYKIMLPKTSKVGIDFLTYVSEEVTLSIFDAANQEVLNEIVAGSTAKPGRYVNSISLSKGTYYVHVMDRNESGDTGKYKLKVTSTHLLPALSVNKVTAHSTKVSGKTEKGATVTMTIGKKSYKRTADAKGNYSFSISKQKVGTSIKISSKNKYGSSVKTVKVTK